MDSPSDILSTETSKMKSNSKVGQEQIHGLLFGDQLSWQTIILDLINSEQLDPWDIDVVILTNRYLEKIKDLEEANLFISSKVLFAAALLVRIKSEIILNQYLPSLDDILFGKKEEKTYKQERIELEEEIPDLVQRTPLPRHRKVTLQELMSALGKAITTENRRIKKVVTARQQEIETAISIPKAKLNLKDRLKDVYSKLKSYFSQSEERVPFTELLSSKGANGEEKVGTFVPLLHLDNSHKIFLEQEKHLEEIYVWNKEHYMKKFAAEFEQMRQDAEAEAAKLQDLEEQIDKAHEAELEKARAKKKMKSRPKKRESDEETTPITEDIEEDQEDKEISPEL